MKKIRLHILLVIILGLLASGCMTDQDFRRQENRITQLEMEMRDLREATKAREMEMDRLLGQARGSLPEMQIEVSRMRIDLQKVVDAVEVAEVRGAKPGEPPLTLKEQLDHARARLDRLEARLRLPPLSTTVVRTTPPEGEGPAIEIREGEQQPEEAAAAAADLTEFNKAKDLYKKGEFAQSQTAFEGFVKEYSESKYAASAQFYIGECLYEQQQYENAIMEYQKVVEKYSKSSKVPTAILKQGFSFLNIGDKTSAKLFLQKVVRSYPKSYAAGVAKEKLKTIK
jgi:tol-pal system protein YbgF